VPPLLELGGRCDPLPVGVEDAGVDEPVEERIAPGRSGQFVAVGIRVAVVVGGRIVATVPAQRPRTPAPGVVEQRLAAGEPRDDGGREPGRARDQIPPDGDEGQPGDRGPDRQDRGGEGNRGREDGDDRDVDGGTRPTAVLAGVFRSPESGNG
jgi:hypothetical protein